MAMRFPISTARRARALFASRFFSAWPAIAGGALQLTGCGVQRRGGGGRKNAEALDARARETGKVDGRVEPSSFLQCHDARGKGSTSTECMEKR